MEKSFSLWPSQASTHAMHVDLFYIFMLAVTAFFTLLIAGLVVFFAVKYRRREGAPPPEKFENVKLELAWTIVPLLISVVMFVWGAKLAIANSKAPENALEIHVIGKQWMWHAQHANGRREINELTVPVGRPVKLTMQSQDVIHSFFIPAFRAKQDVLPGRYSYLWFEPKEPGEYHLFCAEYCGLQHSGMIGKVRVLPQQDYERWLAMSPAGEESMQVAGAKLFAQYGCATCHSQQGPSLAGLYGSERTVWANTPDKESKVVADDNYLRESILYSKAKIVKGYSPALMPTYQGLLTEENVSQLIAYIKTLGKDVPLGNDMTPGGRMQELLPPAPDMKSRNSDSEKRDYR